MFRAFVAVILIVLNLSLYSCSADLSALERYASGAQGYEFLYPSGWIPVEVKEASEGVDIVFHDLIERTENLSVIISSVGENETLADLGTPTEVGYRFMKKVNDEPGSNREAELIDAEVRKTDTNTYYILEYQVKLPNNVQRHDLASVAVRNGKLYTFNLSTRESRWKKVKNLFERVVRTFQVY
ncbi:MAG: photosystem II reaction center PsbP [Prochloraceae cyanobacterium]|nr:photosystem II reaction center PsbP [Prochloraceae cyanobacterium]